MINKTILQICLLLTLITALNFTAFSQTSDSPTVPKGQTVSFLIEQNENARSLISQQEKRIADLENELIVEQENSASVGKSYDLAISEISLLKTSNEALARAVAINENTVAMLQADNAKQREKAKRATLGKWKIYAIAAGVIAFKFLIP